MNEYTKLVLENVDPAAQCGPAMQLPRGAVSLRHRLRELRDQLVASDPRGGGYQAPEALFNKTGVQADIIVEALLTGRPVYQDALFAAQTQGHLQAIVDRDFFNGVWAAVAGVEGVEVILAS